VNPLKYFKISQHEITSNIVTIPDILESELTAARGLVRQIDDPKDKEYLNFYENPYPIISHRFKNAIRPCLPEALGIPMSLANRFINLVVIFWILEMELVENQGIDENAGLIIKHDDIADRKLFKTKTGLRDHVIADFDIIELLLRNSITDIGFTEISVI